MDLWLNRIMDQSLDILGSWKLIPAMVCALGGYVVCKEGRYFS